MISVTLLPAKLIMVGEGPEKEKAEDLCESLGIKDRVLFLGNSNEIDRILCFSDLFLLPSETESFGLAALESTACGTPVVASRVGGLSTIIQHGHTGYLKSWRCPEAFANSLEMITSSKSLLESMGQAARRRAEGMGWDQVASAMAAHYQSLATETA